MRHLILVLLISVLQATFIQAQIAQSPSQSARQALIEMFLSRGGDNFLKHLPDATKRTLFRAGESQDSSFILRLASFAEMVPLGEHVETFDSGPNILTSEFPGEHKRIEVAVEHESLLGDATEIELSVHIFVDGQEQSMQIIPRLTFTLVQERSIWRLAEFTLAAHVPLTDPDYLNGLRKRQDEFDESAAQGRISIIARAEMVYAEQHPQAGFVCSLATLFPPPSANSEGPTYYDVGLLQEEANGYRFSLSGCNGIPATRLQITAVPIDSDSPMKSFCADESGAVKWIAEGPISSCLNEGEPLNKPYEDGVQE